MGKGGRSPVSRILSTPAFRGSTIISLPAEAGLRRIGVRLIPGDSTGGRPFPCSVLHHAGFTVPPSLPPARWALTPPFHPYPPSPEQGRAVCFLLHFPSGRIETAVPLFQGARCPVVSGLSSPGFRRIRQRSPGERRGRVTRGATVSKHQVAACHIPPLSCPAGLVGSAANPASHVRLPHRFARRP